MSAKVYVVISGKGGVGKTIATAAIGAELANHNYKVVLIDFDIGLRNLDLVIGCEKRVVYDFINVIKGEVTLQQALIQDKRLENLFILPASQTRNKDALLRENIGQIIEELKASFDFIICDAPSGIDKGTIEALYFAQEAIIVTTADLASVRAANQIIGLLNQQTKLAEHGQQITKHLLVNRFIPEFTNTGKLLTIEAMQEALGLKAIGIIPESPLALEAVNQGIPLNLYLNTPIQKAYTKCINNLLGKVQPVDNVASKWSLFKKSRKKQPNYTFD